MWGQDEQITEVRAVDRLSRGSSAAARVLSSVQSAEVYATSVACLVLKEFLQLDYRKLSALLADSPDWTAAIGLGRVPHFTTFQKAAQRLLVSRRARRLLDETMNRAVNAKILNRRVKLTAIDGTGLESRHVSLYYEAVIFLRIKNEFTPAIEASVRLLSQWAVLTRKKITVYT